MTEMYAEPGAPATRVSVHYGIEITLCETFRLHLICAALAHVYAT